MCHLTADTIASLPSDPRAPRQARALFDQNACAAHNPFAVDEARLLVSELVANAVTYGAPPVILHIRCIDGVGLRVGVSDSDPRVPAPLVTGSEAESGRGLRLVELLSDAWGVDAHDGGKQVWFRLNVPSA